MKVLMLAPDKAAQGGVAAFCATLRDAFKVEVDYFYSGARDDGRYGPRTVLRASADYARFARTLAAGRYDVVHVNPSFLIGALTRDAGFVRLAKAFGKKAVVFIHGWDKAFEAKLRAKWLRLFRFGYFRADAFVVLAQDFKSRLRTMGYRGPIHVGATAIERSLLEASTTLSPRPPRGGSAFHVLFLSRIVKEKGIEEAIKGFGLLQAARPGATMTVAGDGPYLGEAKKLAEALGLAGVAFAGYVSGGRKVEELRRADCYLFPSFHGEGMPISVLEAMAFGLPVITRPVGALADFFEDGAMGYLTESRSPEVLAELMGKMMDDPAGRERMGRYNREYARGRFSPSAVAAMLEAIYADVTRPGRAAA